jgi:hypothetical protein
MSPFEIARVCHEVNRAYCAALGDTSHLSWEETTIELRESAIRGVTAHLQDSTLTPEQSHQLWLKQKEADGWVYGEKKDPVAKTHPCIKPYAELPQEQRVKDWLFKGVVASLRDR